jgi:beta-N-acetylhexosaminidase
VSARSRAAEAIVVGFDGTNVSDDLASFVAAAPPAGFVFFGRNATSLAQVRELTDALRSLYAQAPPLLAVDQEGGRVARLHDRVEGIPSMMALAATDDETLANRAGAQIGFDLRRAGMNLDFAPVLDLATDPGNTVIGTRSFGDDPQRVTKLAHAVAVGLESSGIVATCKHFPGHGATAADSHLELPVVELDQATLQTRDLAPFVALLPQARAAMTAHLVVRAIDERWPATASRAALTDLLRDRLHFKGVCFTDCMQMKAIAAKIGTAEGAVAALAAGADCVLVSQSLDVARSVAAAIDRALDDGALPAERFEQACERMRTLRSSLTAPLPLDAPPPHLGVGLEIARRSVTLVRGDWRADPATCIAVAFESGAAGAEDPSDVRLSQFAPALQETRMSLEPGAGVVEHMLAVVRESKLRPIVLMQRAHLHQLQAGAVERLLDAHPDALVVSTREPFDTARFGRAHNVLAAYGSDAAAFAGLADVIFGGVEPRGRLPLQV